MEVTVDLSEDLAAHVRELATTRGVPRDQVLAQLITEGIKRTLVGVRREPGGYVRRYESGHEEMVWTSQLPLL